MFCISDKISATYQNFEMWRETPSEQMYFTFEKQSGRRSDRWRIDFPNDFPKSSPLTQVNDDCKKEVKNWNGNYQVLKQIEDCIQRYYDKNGGKNR